MGVDKRISRRTLIRAGVTGGVVAAGTQIGLAKPTATPCERAFHGGVPLNGRPLEHQPLLRYEPTASDSPLPLPGDGCEYRIEAIHLDLSAPDTITITDGRDVIWGPHLLPAGFGMISFPTRADKSESGMRCGLRRTPCVSVEFGVSGAIHVFGFVAPASAHA